MIPFAAGAAQDIFTRIIADRAFREALVAKGAPKEALAPLEASLAVNPFDPQVHCTLASAYGKLASAAVGLIVPLSLSGAWAE